jgi:hypothetical protein
MLTDSDDHEPSHTEKHLRHPPTWRDHRLTISVEEAGQLLGISRGLAYALSAEETSPASGSAAASWYPAEASSSCSTPRTMLRRRSRVAGGGRSPAPAAPSRCPHAISHARFSHASHNALR